MVVILDRQHFGKPGRDDLGAGVDLNDDGVIEREEREAVMTLVYIEAAKQKLEADGHKVIIIDSGWYADRHEEAVGIAHAHPDDMCAYIACHLNAGGGDYSVCLYDHRSGGGRKLALSVAAEMTDQITGVRRHLTKACSPDLWNNAYHTVKGIYAGPGNLSGICFEPVFMDRAEHHQYLTHDGLALIGQTLAEGCMAWGA
jgi:hypothetical protein